jgi:hypothetical protein
MITPILCILSLVTTYYATKRSLGLGLVSLMTWGYLFGILRANFLSTFAYFIFDAAVLGLYLAQMRKQASRPKNSDSLRLWAFLLLVWPVLVFFLPFQNWLISLVGLRGAVMFIPMLIVGGRLRTSDLSQLAIGFSVLNLIALAFAGGEFFLGLPRFYPYNAATALIYGSQDVGNGFYRIPAIFANAHLYGGTMVATIPFLIGLWEHSPNRKLRLFALMGVTAALLGVLMSATRLNFVAGSALILATVLGGRLKMSQRVGIVLVVLLLGIVALRNDRFQRFKSLSETENVEERLSGSVNRGFFEILLEYPMGNGLGGGGTSIPYFLEGQVRNPIGMESEYARILCEQGVIGLGLWIGFIIWFLYRRVKLGGKVPWAGSRRLVWSLSVLALVTGLIGMGMLTAVPTTALLLLGMGWAATPMAVEGDESRLTRRQPILVSEIGGMPRSA